MPNNINLSTLLILVGAIISAIYLTMTLFNDGDGVRTQKIDVSTTILESELVGLESHMAYLKF